MLKKYLFGVLILFLIGCQTESLYETTTNSAAHEKSAILNELNFNEISEIENIFEIKNQISLLKNSSNNFFGAIDTTTIIKEVISPSKISKTYTFLLENEFQSNEVNYFDNLVVTYEGKKQTFVIIRYFPTEDWYNRHNRNFSYFSGIIKFYDINGSFLNAISMENGFEKVIVNPSKVKCVLKLKETKTICVQLLDKDGMATAAESCQTTYIYGYDCTMGTGTYGDDNDNTGPDEPEQVGGSWSPPTIPDQEDDCDTKVEDMEKVFPNTDVEILNSLTALINEYGQEFGIDTKEKMQHFLAQAGHESSNYAGKEFTAFEENLNYQISNLNIDFDNYFNPISNPTADSTKANPNDFIRASNPNYVDPEKFANYVYDDKNRSPKSKLGNINPGDGYKYRGRGIFQLTGKYNYSEFNEFYKLNFDETVNLVNNPDLLARDHKIAVISALWFFENKILNKFDITASTDLAKVTKRINTGLKGIKHRKLLFDKTKVNIDCI